MAKVGSWNTTAANNNSTPPDGWPEGQAPSTVNDCAREMMAQIKTMVNTLEYIDLNNTPSFLTATTFSMATADVVNFTVGRRCKLGDGANTLYGFINSVSATFVSVQLDYTANQLVLDSSLSTIALAVLNPSLLSMPEQAFKSRNILINSNFEIWQRSATFALPNTGAVTYTADRWYGVCSLSANAASNITRFERSANASAVPTVLQCGQLLNSSLIVSVSAIATTIAAGQFAYIGYRVEGFDFRQLAQRNMNLSFWVNTRQSGIYCVALRNAAAGQSFVQNYTVSAIATWTRFSIPIVKSPTAGTWDYSSGIGLQVIFSLATGSTFQGGAGNWTAAALLGTASQVNFFQSAGNTLAIAGVRLEPGSFATPLEVRPYQQEKAMCKRYFQRWPDVAGVTDTVPGFCISTNQAYYFTTFEEMRAPPTVTLPTIGQFVVTTPGDIGQAISAVGTNTIGVRELLWNAIPVGTPFVAGDGTRVVLSATPADFLKFDAEL